MNPDSESETMLVFLTHSMATTIEPHSVAKINSWRAREDCGTDALREIIRNYTGLSLPDY